MVTALSETLTREEFERRLLVRFHLFVETLQSYYHEHAEDFGIPPGNTAGWSNETRIALIRTLQDPRRGVTKILGVYPASRP